MIEKALALLNLNPQDEVVDFFSGLGLVAFSMVIRKKAATIITMQTFLFGCFAMKSMTN